MSAILAAPFEKDAEADLIRAAQQGDQDAFERLVRAYDQSVLRLAMNLLRSPDEARDVYQEAFLKVYRNLHLFRFDCSFHTWLYRIVTNVCLDHLRRRKVRKEESTVVETPDGPVDQVTKIAEEGPAGNPERQMWNRELSAGIAAALEGLTPRRADGLRAPSLRRAAFARHRRDSRHHGRSRQELPVPRDAKDEDSLRLLFEGQGLYEVR